MRLATFGRLKRWQRCRFFNPMGSMHIIWIYIYLALSIGYALVAHVSVIGMGSSSCAFRSLLWNTSLSRDGRLASSSSPCTLT